MMSNSNFHDVAVEANTEAVMRDGTVLRADVYHPADGGKHPALLCRTPYQKLTPHYVELAKTLAERGYTAIVQDQRGRYASDGEYRWMWRRQGQAGAVRGRWNQRDAHELRGVCHRRKSRSFVRGAARRLLRVVQRARVAAGPGRATSPDKALRPAAISA